MLPEARAGFAAFDFDPRHVGASEGWPRQVLRASRQVDDLHAAVACLRRRDDVDPDRVGVWGSSLGGGLAMDVAAADQRLAGAVAVVPQVDGLTNLPDAPLGVRVALMAAAVADGARRLVGRSPLLVPAFGRSPSSRAVLTRDNAWKALIEGVQPGGHWLEPARVYETGDSHYRNEVPGVGCLLDGLLPADPARGTHSLSPADDHRQRR